MDLFGNEIEKLPLDLNEQYIKDREEVFFHDKVRRLKHLHKINPEGLTLAGQSELVLGYREVQLCFIDGHFLATIVLAQAFVEKVLHNHYNSLGFEKVANSGLNRILAHAKESKIINEFIINKIDKIRKIRNPITHLKDFEYEHSLDKRAFKNRYSLEHQLEIDATQSIEIATFIAVTDLKQIF